jgi:hypothetical protein
VNRRSGGMNLESPVKQVPVALLPGRGASGYSG